MHLPNPTTAGGAAALLFLMLVGEPPARAGYESESALADTGVFDKVLRVALYHALARDLGVRSHDLRPLKRELARWFVEHAGEEPIAPGPHSTSPPPLPPSVRPSQLPRPSQPPRRSVPAPPPKKKPSQIADAGLLRGRHWPDWRLDLLPGALRDELQSDRGSEATSGGRRSRARRAQESDRALGSARERPE